MICAVAFTAAQNTQTDEATRLSVEVVKLFNEKKFKEAIPVAQKVVALRQQKEGANDLKTGEALRNLAFVQVAAGDKKEAADSFEKAIEIYRKKSDLNKDSQIQLAQMTETLAFYKFEDRKIDKAAELYRSASELREKVHGRDALELVPSLWGMANILQYKRDYKNAEELYRRVYEIRAKKLERNSWDTQEARGYYYCMAVRNDKGTEALEFIKSLQPENSAPVPNAAKSDVKYINGGVINGKATYLAKPAYPREARVERAGGAITVQTTIGEDGKVIFACAVSGNKLLYEASESAAYQSIFQPTTLAGKPVKVTGVITYNFVP